LGDRFRRRIEEEKIRLKEWETEEEVSFEDTLPADEYFKEVKIKKFEIDKPEMEYERFEDLAKEYLTY